MNTRLQVEHPRHRAGHAASTSSREQIRVAVGRAAVVHPGRHRAAAATPSRCRINAEDPAGGSFLPSPGTITHAACRRTGFGVRWDGGYESGDEVSQYYDNLVGKLIVWGADRDTRHRPHAPRARRVRDRGHRTPRSPRDLAILATPTSPPPSTPPSGSRTTLDLTGVARRRRRRAAPTTADGDAEPLVERDVDVEVNGKRFAVKLWVPDGRRAAPPARRRARATAAPGAPAAAGGGGRQRHGHRADAGHDREGARRGRATRSRPVRPCCVLEAMKMENHISAEKAGTVDRDQVAAGDTVGAGDVLVVIE